MVLLVIAIYEFINNKRFRKCLRKRLRYFQAKYWL